MIKTTLIIVENGEIKHYFQQSLTQAIDILKNLSETAQIQFCNIAGIDGFKIYQNYANQIPNCIEIFKLFENMNECDVAKCMLLSVKLRLDLLDTPNHLHLIKHAQRIGPDDSLQMQAKNFMQYLQWQGFEFLSA